MLLPEFCEEFYYVKKINLFKPPFKNYLEKVYDYSFLETKKWFKGLKIPKNYRIKELKKLTYLSLCYNRLKTIINLNLPSLQILYLSVNELKEIPTLTFLSSLQTLSLSFNQLTEIPNLTFLPNLREFHLFHNELTEISILKLNLQSNLKFLNLGDNKLTEKSIMYLKSLKLNLFY